MGGEVPGAPVFVSYAVIGQFKAMVIHDVVTIDMGDAAPDS